MRTFTLRLLDATHGEDIDGVTAFIAEDISGCFGILAGHMRIMTKLIVGLARFRVGDDLWHYLAVPGAVLYYHGNLLTLSASRYLIDDDYMRISHSLEQQLLADRGEQQAMKVSLLHMEEEIFRRLWKKNRKTID